MVHITDEGDFHDMMTHLLVGKKGTMRTHKELAALMNGAWILTLDWFLGALDYDKTGTMLN